MGIKINTIDFETELITAHCKIPRPVSMSHDLRPNKVDTGVICDGSARKAWWQFLKGLTLGEHACGQNIAFDFGVGVEAFGGEEIILDAYENNQIRDIGIRQRLIDIAQGSKKKYGNSLASMARDHLGISIGDSKRADKAVLAEVLAGDFARLAELPPRYRFGELRDLPFDEWPPEFKDYAEDDVLLTKRIFIAQGGMRSIANEHEAAKAAWVLHCCSARGLKIDMERVAEVKAEALAKYEEHQAIAIQHGLIREELKRDISAVRAMVKACLGSKTRYTKAGAVALGSKVMQAAIEVAKLRGEGKVRDALLFAAGLAACPAAAIELGLYSIKRSKDTSLIVEWIEHSGLDLEAHKTETGKVATGKETLLAALAESDDPEVIEGLRALVEMSGPAKVLQTYIKALEKGADGPIMCRYKVLMDTGRTSSNGPNVQNLPRNGGLRECFIPREGNVFITADYTAAEMACLAQVCIDLGFQSKLAQAINKGIDLHSQFAALMLDRDYDEVLEAVAAGEKWAKDARQLAKVANFGFPGGMGINSLIDFAWAAYKIIISRKQARGLKRIFLRLWSALPLYFDHCAELSNAKRPQVQKRSGRVRGGAGYCQFCNSAFQGLAADGAKDALFTVQRATRNEASPMFGYNIAIFVHDEIIIEGPKQGAGAALEELKRLMVEAMMRWTPDVQARCEGKIMARWEK